LATSGPIKPFHAFFSDDLLTIEGFWEVL